MLRTVRNREFSEWQSDLAVQAKCRLKRNRDVQTAFAFKRLSQFAVPLFVFQTAAAGAGVVAVDDLSPRFQGFGAEIRSIGIKGLGNQIGLRLTQKFFHIGRFGMDGLDVADGLLFNHRDRVLFDLNRGKQGGNMEFDAVPQVLEHGKGFTFIFLLRIFLA